MPARWSRRVASRPRSNPIRCLILPVSTKASPFRGCGSRCRAIGWGRGAQGAHPEGWRRWREGGALAAPAGWTRVFLDEGGAIGALLGEAYGQSPAVDSVVD